MLVKAGDAVDRDLERDPYWGPLGFLPVDVEWRSGDQLITMPGQGDIKVGLLRAAIKKAGLSVDEFLELLGRR